MLRLACTVRGRSAQQLVTDALDALLAALQAQTLRDLEPDAALVSSLLDALPAGAGATAPSATRTSEQAPFVFVREAAALTMAISIALRTPSFW